MPSFLSVKKTADSLDKELAASGFTRKEQVEMEKYIEEDAEAHDSSSNDDDDEDDDEVGDVVPLVSLKIDQGGSDEPDCNLASRDSDVPRTFSEEHGTSYGENRLESPPSDGNGKAMKPLQSGSQEDGNDDDDDSSEDANEEDAELTKQLNKQRKKAIAAVHGRRRPASSRNAYKDSTMNSKIQRMVECLQCLLWQC